MKNLISRIAILSGILLTLVTCVSGLNPGSAVAAELAAQAVLAPVGGNGPRRARFSERSLSVGLSVHRDGAELLSYTVKDAPFDRTENVAAPLTYSYGRPVRLELVLHGPGGQRFTERVDVGPLCLSHPRGTPPHIEGDTILLHEDSVLVQLPEVPGLDRVDVSFHEEDSVGRPQRRALGMAKLDRAHFWGAGGEESYEELAFADPTDPTVPAALTTAQLLWPEDFADPDIYRVYGDESEAAQRINITLVPDGYTYADKALMEQHADQVVAHFRGKTPYAEHDNLINYNLVYAYSVGSGTDQCDCGTVVDNAMGTRFPDAGGACGSSQNRCLYYGSGCDTYVSGNLVAAEQRAPLHDKSLVMVNTTRYGGCGGSRAVYSAGNSSANEVAVHELGHSLAGLADEYTSNTGCGGSGGEVNTSTNAVDGAWPEWIADIGAPREGARYYTQCIYRPLNNCEMRALNQPFCPVCNQRWSLVLFGHSRTNPTAPIASASPASPVAVNAGVSTNFSVGTRLASGPSITNSIEWSVQGPGDPSPTVVATGVQQYSHSFSTSGEHTVRCTVIADTNFVKPSKVGSNVDTAVWTVDVAVNAVCGDGVAEGAEQCDGADLAGASCSDLGCSGGTPSCTSGCTLDYSGCSDCPVCDGDGTCETDENCNDCPADCISGSSGGAVCGNKVCETADGENCSNCSADCNGVQNGKPSRRYCCGSDTACGDTRCTAGGNACSSTSSPPVTYCCGDFACTGAENGSNCSLDCGVPGYCGDDDCDASDGEDICSCASDCGAPPSSETICSGGQDEDCDGNIDCDDSDCALTSECQCGSAGTACTSGTDCCSNKCKGKNGSKTCR